MNEKQARQMITSSSERQEFFDINLKYKLGNPKQMKGEKNISASDLPFLLRQIQKDIDNQDQQQALVISLWLQNNKIGEKGCLNLLKAPLHNIILIDISDNNIGDKGCKNLTKSSWFNLIGIFLNNNRISWNGCLHLTKVYWKDIKHIYLCDNPIGTGGLEILRRKFTCTISWGSKYYR